MLFQVIKLTQSLSKKMLLMLIITPILISTCIAQTASIRGKILVEGKPAAFVSIAVKQSQLGTVTDEWGNFSLKNMPIGTQTLVFSSVSYLRQEKTVKLTAGETLKLQIELQENQGKLNEVVISGTMKEVSLMESPIHIETYTPTFFKKNPTPGLFDALQLVNGVRPQLNCNVCNTGDIHINGMEGPYTMITIDGMPIVSALSTVYGLSGIPNSMVERIEIVKGPASTLYGSEAVGGLINIITKSPATAPLVTVDLFATSHQEYNADVSVKYKLKRATSLLSGSYFNFMQKRDINHDNFTDLTLQNRISIFNKWSFERKQNRVADIAARYVYEDRWGGQLDWNRNFRGGDSIYGESIFTKRIELIGRYQLPLATQKVMLSYSFNNHHQNSYYGNVPFMATQRIGFAQLYHDYKLGQHDLLSGTALRYTYYDDDTPGTQSADTGNPSNKPSHTFLPGVFVQDEITLTEQHKLLAGLRYDYHSKHGNIFSPRINYKWTPNKDNIVRLSLGNGYRVVNLFTEDHAALTGSRQVIVVSELKPERSYNANLSYNKYINHNAGFISLDATGFFSFFTNKIVGDFQTDENKIIYDNLSGYAVSRGLTLNSDFTFTFPLKVIAGFTLMDVYSVEEHDKQTQKIQQLHAPAFSGTYTVSYSFTNIGLTLDYSGNVSGPMSLPTIENDTRPSRSPWFSIQNIQATKKLGNAFEIYGGIKNLLDFIPSQQPITRFYDPFEKQRSPSDPITFDATYNYAPIQGIRSFLGVRYKLVKD